MKRTWLVSFFAILFITGLFTALIKYRPRFQEEMAELHLQQSLNYCVDAAVEEMKETSDIHLDYTEWDKIKVDPMVAYNEFLDMFCFNYGVMPNKENRESVSTDFIPTFVVTTMDGYYIAKQQVVRNNSNNTEYGLQFSPKLPYSVTDKNKNVTYGLNLSGSSYFASGKNSNLYFKGIPDMYKNKKEEIAGINKILTAAVGSAINEANEESKSWENAFYLPGVFTDYVKTNPVEGPSVIALAQNVDWECGRKVDAFSIGGGKLKRADAVACYIRKIKGVNVSYYTYLDKVPEGVTILEVVMSPEEAALRGYACDTTYMS